MRGLEQIRRFIKIHRSQPSKAKENDLPKNQAKATAEFFQIPNPYLPVQTLDPRFDSGSLFVGRQKIAIQIEDAIENTKHPTFFLIGERRMGKTSFLLQLPNLLKKHYISVFVNLQSPAMTSSITYLLATIAENIYETIILRGYHIPRLEYDDLSEASKEDVLLVFYRFEQWLGNIEQVFDQDVHAILIAFDEFEFLIGRDDGYLDLELLFSWLHKITQSNSSLVFLFCGVTPISDINNKGSFSFDNIQTGCHGKPTMTHLDSNIGLCYTLDRKSCYGAEENHECSLGRASGPLAPL